uniref:Uncharacterized protein n=1 Tax=Pithovirus LCPAC101 TaxID=2506586 RepID=A0A481Z435_9VIRU|nr:MAG: hypothetical protein LCPAC101_00320 [Pithovirus LCPAC101]
METKVNEKIVWLRSGKSKYLFDKRNGMKINYFREAMDEKYGAKEYIDNNLVLSISEEFGPVLVHIIEYIENINITKIDKVDNYKLLIQFSDFILDDGIIDKIIDSDNISWLLFIESCDIIYINIKKLEYILNRYSTIFKEFTKIYRCAMLWNKTFYTKIFECLYKIDKTVITYMNINNINENSSLLSIKNIELSNYLPEFGNKNNLDGLYKDKIDKIVFVGDDDEGNHHILITVNNITYRIGGDPEWSGYKVYVELHDYYDEYDMLDCLKKHIINIKIEDSTKIKSHEEYVIRHTCTIIFSDYSKFQFILVNTDGYYGGWLTIERVD